MMTGIIQELSFGESLLVLVLGVCIILFALGLLVGLLYIIKYAVKAIESTPKKASKKAENVKADVANVEICEDNDEETVAAITAAITAIMAQDAAGDDAVVAPFKIKKIRHIR